MIKKDITDGAKGGKEVKEVKGGKVVYCHFSVRRPDEKEYGTFGVACYSDYEGKKLLVKEVKVLKLWEEGQHVASIQSYQFALDWIFRHQVALKNKGVSTVVLMSSNEYLIGWIMREGRNKYYSDWVEHAVENYRFGGKKEIKLAIALDKYTGHDRIKKFCIPRFVENMEEYESITELKGTNKAGKYEFELPTGKNYGVQDGGQGGDIKFRTIADDLDEITPKISDTIIEI